MFTAYLSAEMHIICICSCIDVMIMTVFADIMYAYSTLSCASVSARERIFMGKFQPFFIHFLSLRKYLHHKNRAFALFLSLFVSHCMWQHKITEVRFMIDRSNSLCVAAAAAAAESNRIKYAKDDPKRNKKNNTRKKYACKHWCNCYW